MGFTMSGRRGTVAGGLCVAVLACLLALAGTGTAAAATTVYPAGGSDFTGGAQGWSSADASCMQTSGVLVLCSTTNAYDGSVGNPAGSLDVKTDVTVNVLGMFEGLSTWQSPNFTPSDEGDVTEIELEYDRRFDAGGLVLLQPFSNVAVTLIDLTAPSATVLSTEALTTANSTFATKSVTVPTSAITAGHTYRLRFRTITGAGQLGLLGQIHTRYDNVRLSVTTS